MALRILLAEDDVMLGQLLSDRMSMEGWSVDWVHDGEEASAKLAGTYDAMILDIMMPKKDGFGVLADAKAKGVHFPILVASNLSEQEQLERARELGAADIIVKSDIDLDSLTQRVSDVVASYAHASS